MDQINSLNKKEEASNRLKESNKKWKTKERLAVRILNFRFMMTIKFLEFDKTIQKRIRTNNPIERYIEEIRRRIIPMRSFNSYESLDRLLFGTINIINVNLRE
ncbi:MAG: transposase, partial [Fervidobacterium sp.]